jgi:hypothetical protein
MCQVFDVIWNPETIKKAQKDPVYRQVLVELAFAYVKQKTKKELSLSR